MKMMNKPFLSLACLMLGTVLVLSVTGQSQTTTTPQTIVQSSLLTSLAPGASFPFMDTTPNRITQAHIAVADATSNCTAGAAAPTNIQVMVGVAGTQLVNVMTAATNAGVGSPTQCVFHVTVVPGANGVPGQITDIVVVNGSGAPLTGVNTVTVSAQVGPPM